VEWGADEMLNSIWVIRPQGNSSVFSPDWDDATSGGPLPQSA